MKKIQSILLIIAVLLPASVGAASITFVPSFGNYDTGSTFSTSVYVNPASGETISASKLSLTFPANTLEVISYTPVSGGSILVHLGTNTDNLTGEIVDNIAFNPGIIASTKVATIIFKAKTDGQAQIEVTGDSKLLDSTNTDKNTGSIGANYTVTTPVLVVPITPVPAPVPVPASVQPPVVTEPVTEVIEGDGATTTTATTTIATTTEATITEEVTPLSDQSAAVSDANTDSQIPWKYLILVLVIIGGVVWGWRRLQKE